MTTWDQWPWEIEGSAYVATVDTDPAGCERWLWVSPLGTTRELTAFVNGTEVMKGIRGRYRPKSVITRQVIPNRAGQVTTNRRHDYRQLPFPLAARGDDITALQALLAVLAQEMDPLDGPGILRYIGTDGRVSDLECIQTADFDPSDWVGSSGSAGQFMTLMFEADEPYFLSTEVNDSWQGEDPTAWFGIGGTGYWVPISLGASSVIGDTVINTSSDADVWPIWDVVGPSSGEGEITNNTTGDTLAFTAPALAAGDTIHIDTAPGVKTVTGPGGTNYFRYLTETSLWPLVKGDNDITLSLTGATSASYIALRYRPRTFAP